MKIVYNNNLYNLTSKLSPWLTKFYGKQLAFLSNMASKKKSSLCKNYIKVIIKKVPRRKCGKGGD